MRISKLVVKMGWFYNLFGIKNTVDHDTDILCNGFLNPIVDNGEIFEKWETKLKKEENEKYKENRLKICPHTKNPCCLTSCMAYKPYKIKMIEKQIPLSEKIDAWIEKRPVKKSYVGYYYESKCKKGVF